MAQTRKVLGKCYVCLNPLRASQRRTRMYLSGSWRTVHTDCTERTSPVEQAVKLIQDTFPGTTVTESETPITDYHRKKNDDAEQEGPVRWDDFPE